MTVNLLYVEGRDDRDFHQSFCKIVGLKDVEVKIITPVDLDADSGDGWSNLINNLPILLKQINAGSIDKLGLILDADFPPDDSGGFIERYTLVTSKLNEFGYNIPVKPNNNKGEIFSHPDNLPSIGLWIMPNHKDDGMLENFIESLVTHENQLSLLAYADKSIKNLPITLFNQKLHSTKAKIFSWRAWQKRPGLPLNSALNKGILDRTKASNFEKWLNSVFN
ncbi:MAG: hypothetical protein HOP06_04960 [Methylotenera sp.]|nr:hypothetical protein [Methylotenera sp.]